MAISDFVISMVIMYVAGILMGRYLIPVKREYEE